MLLKFITSRKKNHLSIKTIKKKKKKKRTPVTEIRTLFLTNSLTKLSIISIISPIKFVSQYSKERQIRTNTFSPSLVRQMCISLTNNYAFNSQMIEGVGGLFKIVPIFGKTIIKPINLAAFGDISGSSTNNSGKLNNYGFDRRLCTFRGGHPRALLRMPGLMGHYRLQLTNLAAPHPLSYRKCFLIIV